jgi:DnaJ like chaperone protein
VPAWVDIPAKSSKLTDSNQVVNNGFSTMNVKQPIFAHSRMVNITGRFFGTLVGWLFYRFEGAIAGFLLGTLYDELVKARNPDKSETDDEATYTGNTPDFNHILISLSAAVMKSDGKTTRSELNYVKEFFIRQFGVEQTKQDLLFLREALKHQVPLDRICLVARARMNYQTRVQLLHYLFGIAHADGTYSHSEASVLNRIALLLQINQEDYVRINSMFGGGVPPKAPPATNRSYELLEIQQSATDDEVKKAYRQMALKYHPDRVTHLGEEARKSAEEKFKKVQEAYEAIKRDRGFS